MSRITPTAYADALRDWLGDRVRFEPGWETRTSAGGFDAHGFVHHWDAIPASYSLGVHRRVLRAGRPGLPGPLCHLAPTRGGDVWVIAGPHANTNHAGLGDRHVWREVLGGRFDGSPAPRGEDIDGNVRLYGLEYMFHPDDGPMPDEQVEAGVLACAALAQAHGWSPDAAAGSSLDHYEWAARKWDRNIGGLAGRTRAGIRAALTGGPTLEDDMTAADVWHHKLGVLGAEDGREVTAGMMLRQAHNRAGDARAAARAAYRQARRNRAALAALADRLDDVAPGVADAVVDALGDRIEIDLTVVDEED